MSSYTKLRPIVGHLKVSDMELPPVNVDLSAINLNLSVVLEFLNLQRKIKPLLSILGKTPSTPVEILLCLEDDIDQNQISPTVIQDAKKLYSELKEAVQEQKLQSLSLWDNIKLMWEEATEKEEFDLAFTNGRIGIYKALQNLHQEQLLAKSEREKHIQKLILSIRSEISDLWKQCMISDDERKQFLGYTSTTFDENCLELHQLELVKLKAFHQKNQVLFEQLEKRRILWQRMKELQTKLEDPNKYTNRGATLLNNQKEMNFVTVKIPKVEETLKQLARKFEQDNGRKLLVRGRTIPQIFDDEWTEYKSANCRRGLKRRLNRPV